MLNNEETAAFFTGAEARIEGNRNLGIPQIEGHEAARSYFEGGGHRAVEQIPVGCGKSGLLSILAFGIARGRVLVIAPNLTIKRQLADAMDISSADCFFRKAGVLTNLSSGPYRATLDADANLSDCNEVHVVVTNIGSAAGGCDELFGWNSRRA